MRWEAGAGPSTTALRKIWMLSNGASMAVVTYRTQTPPHARFNARIAAFFTAHARLTCMLIYSEEW
jgi:hypothetical protein